MLSPPKKGNHVTGKGQIDGETREKVTDFIFLGSKITADGDCSHDIKRHLTPWKESYDWPRQYIKKQRHCFANKGPSHQSYSFSSSHEWIWDWSIKKAECQRINYFELWCWRRHESPLTTWRSNQSILKEISLEYSFERWMLKLKLQYFVQLMWRSDSFEKTLTGKDWRPEVKGTTEDKMVGWCHGLTGHEFE